MKALATLGILLFSSAVFCFGQITSSGTDSLQGTGSFSRALSRDSGQVSGTVVSIDGRPQQDVLVHIHDFSTRSVAASVYTGPDGRFTFDALPTGSYELVATRDSDTVRAEVTVNGTSEIVTLRLNVRDPSAPPAQSGIVSLSQLKVPQRARDAYAKAEQAAAKGQSEEMLRHLQKALEIYPDYAPALTLRAAFSLDKDNATRALQDLDKAIHADSTFAQAHALRAAALNRMSKFDEALRSAERASSLAPTSWQPYYEMAKSYFGKTDYQRSLEQLTHARSELAQDYAPLLLLRAQVFLRVSNYAEASNDLTRFLKIAPNAPNAASVRNLLERLNAAVASGTEVVKDEPR